MRENRHNNVFKTGGVTDVSTDVEKRTIKVKYDSKKISEAELLAAMNDRPKYTVTKPTPAK